jgi:serine protease Do
MSDEHNEKHDKNQKNSEKPQQYFVEGYFDTAYSMPAETDPTHSYQIKASSALPAFPPLNDRDPDGDKLRSARPLILILVGLLAALLLLTVIRFALRYDLTISRENGTIHITIHRKAGSEALLDGVIPTQAGTEGVVENDGSTVQPSPGSHEYDSRAFELAGIPSDQPELTYQQVYKNCIDSMVSVYSFFKDSQKTGAGVILSADGYIITNNHLIDGSTNVVVLTSDGSEYQAALVGRDSVSDLAVLKIDATRLKPAQFGDSDLAEVGDSVLAIGNPLNKTLSMTDGIISAINRNVGFNGYYITLIQTNADINEGSSGGALINRFGQVIGITNMKIVSVNNTIEGMGFAIPMKEAKPIIEELMLRGFIAGRPSLGILVEDITAVASVFYKLPTGVYIVSLYENSDAYRQGLLQGDIIVAANGIKIENREALYAVLNSLGVGDSVTLDIYRISQNQYYTVQVALMDASSFD